MQVETIIVGEIPESSAKSNGEFENRPCGKKDRESTFSALFYMPCVQRVGGTLLDVPSGGKAFS